MQKGDRQMAQKLMQTKNNGYQFPPEADGEFEVVSDEAIATLREKLAERFGIGQGRLEVIEEPKSLG